ncbi:hypothetical protein [Bradyrhizobium sp. CCBAU 11386]|uniref:hypothetical protein n=1 Tax=Bradyrhizobium sp. CCBAU 11386 TaxID=1630837 RepID=UPI002304319C|nr:hypothetical protein [Bradyrhizobium sp. CCBAU 11386]
MMSPDSYDGVHPKPQIFNTDQGSQFTSAAFTGDDEPELGSLAGRRQFDQRTWAAGQAGEPSLRAIEEHPEANPATWWSEHQRSNEGTQVAWAESGADDLEDEHDGREPDVDDELSGDEEEPSGSFD